MGAEFPATSAGMIPTATIDAKGDLLVGTGDNAIARLPVGATTGHVLTVDPTTSFGVAWKAAPAAGGGGGAPAAHASTHLPNGTDAIDWSGLIHRRGAEGSLPAAGASNSGELYIASDTGTIFRSNGSAWVPIAFMPNILLNGGVGDVYDNGPGARTASTADAGSVATGQMTVVAVPLPKGAIITGISICSGATAAGTPTHWWFALYDPSLSLIAQSADQATTAWAANTIKRLTLAGGPYTMAASGVHYVGVMVAATTVPTLRGPVGLPTIVSPGYVAAQKRVYAKNGSALTTTAPNGPLTLVDQGNGPYAVLN